MGVFPALTIPALAAFVVFALVLRLGRYMSVASMSAGLSLSLFVAAWFHLASRGVSIGRETGVEVRHMVPFLVFALLLGVMIVITHRGNIARLRAGTEPRWVKKKGE